METHFTDSQLSAPPGLEKSNVIITNEGNSSPMSPFQRQEWKKDRWALIGQYVDCNDPRYFVEEGDKSGFRVRLVHIFTGSGPGGDHVELRGERFLPGVGFDVVTKQQVPTRKRVIKHSEAGEPIFPVFNIAACEFVTKYKPDGWMSHSEWAAAKVELAPIIEEEKAILDASRAMNLETAARRMEATAAAQNPQAYMASAIAAGVAMAMKEMNLVPRKTKD